MTPEQFNEKYPVGTPVHYKDDFGELHETTTRSEAWKLGHGDAVVMLQGRTGGVSLDRVTKRKA